MPWVVLDVVVALVALAVLALCALRLWRGVKALGREIGRAGEQVGAASDALARVQADGADRAPVLAADPVLPDRAVRGKGAHRR